MYIGVGCNISAAGKTVEPIDLSITRVSCVSTYYIGVSCVEIKTEADSNDINESSQDVRPSNILLY